jgi:hypothetical protein
LTFGENESKMTEVIVNTLTGTGGKLSIVNY